jgi:hypothetical protein
MVDGQGFPTNPEYLAAQGFDPVTANRELVSTQEQLNQVADLFATADEATIGAFVAEYRRAMGESGPGPGPGALPGPGQSPMLVIPRSSNDVEYWFNRMGEIHNMGITPLPGQRAKVAQAWGEFPEDALIAIARQLPDV